MDSDKALDLTLVACRELLEKIKDFEEREFSGTKREADFNPMPLMKLEPLNEGGGAGLLQQVGLWHTPFQEIGFHSSHIK